MKKIIKIVFCLVITCICGCNTNQNNKESDDIPNSDKAVNSVLKRGATLLEQKYNMQTIGAGVSMPQGNLKSLILDFQIKGPLSKKIIRKILVNSAQDFIKLINSDDTIKQYMAIYPFTIKNISITLFLENANGLEIGDPNIGMATISEGDVFYFNLVTTDLPSIKSETKESYEEALIHLRDNWLDISWSDKGSLTL